MTYPVAGWLGARIGIEATFAVMAAAAAFGVILAMLAWPRHDPLVIEHDHGEAVHAHGAVDHAHHGGEVAAWIDEEDGTHRHRMFRHAHAFTIDDHHPVWPRG